MTKRPTGIICSWLLWQVQLVDMLVRRFVFITISCSCQHNSIVVRGFFMWQEYCSCYCCLSFKRYFLSSENNNLLWQEILSYDKNCLPVTSVLTENVFLHDIYIRQSRIFPDCSNFLPNAFWSLYIEFQCERNKNTGIISTLELLFCW